MDHRFELDCLREAKRKKPPIMAVKSPCSGLTPDAMAIAIERGRAMIDTIMPAFMSRIKSFRVYPFKVEKSFGFKTDM